MKLVVLITAETEKGLDVALAWRDAGAPGVTILRAFGLYTLQREIEGTVELPRMVASMAAAMASIITDVEERGHFIMSLVDDSLIDRLVNAATQVMGDLTLPNHGILFVLPVDLAIGVRNHGLPSSG